MMELMGNTEGAKIPRPDVCRVSWIGRFERADWAVPGVRSAGGVPCGVPPFPRSLETTFHDLRGLVCERNLETEATFVASPVSAAAGW